MWEFLLHLLEVSITVSIIGMLIVLCSSKLNKKFPLRWKRAAWFVIALRLLLPFSLSLPQAPVTVEISRTVNRTVAIPSTGMAPVVNEMTMPTGQLSDQAGIPWTLLVFGLWGIVALMVFAKGVLQYLFFKRAALRWSLPATAVIADNFNAVCDQLGTGKCIRVRVSVKVDGPVLMGMIRPVILLPSQSYTEEELKLLFCHELMHYKSKDTWLKFLLHGAKAMHWFNPFVYHICRQAEQDIELACDEKVIEVYGNRKRKAYGSLILSGTKTENIRPLPLTTSFSPGKKQLTERILNLMQKEKRRGGIILLGICIVLVLSSGLLVACKTAESSEKVEPDTIAIQEETTDAILSEYTKLLELKPENYEEMTIAQFREEVFAAREKNEEEILDLIDKVDDELQDMRYTNQDASFICNTLIPLTAAYNYPVYHHAAGWMEIDEYDYEVWLNTVITAEDKLTVGEYSAAVSGIISEAGQLLTELDKEQLMDEEILQSAFSDIVARYQNNYIELTPVISYESLEDEDNEIDTSEEYVAANEADFRQLLALQIPDYEEMSVTDYRSEVEQAFSREETGINEAYERVFLDMYVDEVSVDITEEEKYFLRYTLEATVADYSAEQQSQYSNKRKLPFYSVEYTNLELEAQVFLRYDIEFDVLTPDTLTIRERDQKISSLMQEITAYLDDRTYTEWCTGKDDCIAALEEFCSRYSDESMYFRVDIDEHNYIY